MFSQVDAHVGAHIFNEAILSVLKDKTRILVTHALHVLPKADLIVVLEGGRIVERGTFDELMKNGANFSRFAKEFGMEGYEGAKEESSEISVAVKEERREEQGEPRKAGKALAAKEDQASGSVSFKVWKEYARAANGIITIPLMFLSLFLMGASQGEFSLFSLKTPLSVPIARLLINRYYQSYQTSPSFGGKPVNSEMFSIPMLESGCTLVWASQQLFSLSRSVSPPSSCESLSRCLIVSS